MELIDQRTKKIMEGCKERARDAGLRFDSETLEYIVTNRDLIELTPKLMIPNLYDYWVHDVEVLREKGRYELYPSNPYETVINTRPAISYYNDNNPDWLNVMIFYHVLGHIDFFQNNLFFRHTWDYDFNGRALSDKRLIANLRAEKGRWVDYTIEFTRGIDNLVGYYNELSRVHRPAPARPDSRLDYYFDVFLQTVKGVRTHEYVKEVERYNRCKKELGGLGDQAFFSEIAAKHPEFEALYRKHLTRKDGRRADLIQFLIENSPFLQKEDNRWMRSIMEVVHGASMFFQPQIRTKILNEGWASYWHERLFLQDDRIRGHEVEFARVNSGVTVMPRVGLNPYALGMLLLYHVEELAEKGRLSYEFDSLADADKRKIFDRKTGQGKEVLFKVREDFSDFTFINSFVDQDFINKHQLFVVGRRLNQQRMVWEYYVRSRKAEDYRQMLLDQLYHPPHIQIDRALAAEGTLYLVHHFEGKPLVADFIPNTMLGIEYLWGGPVKLETTEAVASPVGQPGIGYGPSDAGERVDLQKQVQFRRVVYTMQNRKLSKQDL
ncbi:MAG: SpoVR family protein [Acidobacteriota bacterium]